MNINKKNKTGRNQSKFHKWADAEHYHNDMAHMPQSETCKIGMLGAKQAPNAMWLNKGKKN